MVFTFFSLGDFNTMLSSGQESYLHTLSARALEDIPRRLSNRRDMNLLSEQLAGLVEKNTLAQGQHVLANSDQTMLYCSNYIYRGTTDWFKFCVNMHGLIVECERITPSAHSLSDT